MKKITGFVVILGAIVFTSCTNYHALWKSVSYEDSLFSSEKNIRLAAVNNISYLKDNGYRLDSISVLKCGFKERGLFDKGVLVTDLIPDSAKLHEQPLFIEGSITEIYAWQLHLSKPKRAMPDHSYFIFLSAKYDRPNRSDKSFKHNCARLGNVYLAQYLHKSRNKFVPVSDRFKVVQNLDISWKKKKSNPDSASLLFTQNLYDYFLKSANTESYEHVIEIDSLVTRPDRTFTHFRLKEFSIVGLNKIGGLFPLRVDIDSVFKRPEVFQFSILEPKK